MILLVVATYKQCMFICIYKIANVKIDSDWSRPVHYISIKLAAHVTRAL